ncbi:hypothetical protein CGQ17_23500, partial [Enterobacter cloacae]
GAAGAEDGEEKAVCIGLPHKVHTVPVVSVRPRVALYFVNIYPQGNKSFTDNFASRPLIYRMWQTHGNCWQSVAIDGKPMITFTD